MRPFRDVDSQSWFRGALQGVLEKIESLENDYVLKASESELEKHFISMALIEDLQLHTDKYYIEKKSGTQIDVSYDPAREVFIQGTRLDIAIPCEGDSGLLFIQPSTYLSGEYPEIQALNDRILISVQYPDNAPNPDQLKQQIKQQIESLASAVGQLQKDVAKHNDSVPYAVKTALARKREKALASNSTIESLGIPMKRTATEPVYTVPTRRKKIPTTPPRVETGKYEPEPVLAMEEYKHILDIIRSMALVIERSPHSFATLDEEAIRMHFLIQLNGHYEGDATGETFNAVGKTDILIRSGDRNVFIAECKFWTGPKGFDDAISQLLSYLTWRDSKCALVVFNKTKNSSAVREKMHATMCARSEFRKTVQHTQNSDSQYVFVKADEPGREVTITTQLFDIPKTPKK